MNNKIKTIIFDLGGVIVNSFGKELIEYSSDKLNIKPAELRQLINKYEPDLEMGKIDYIEFWQKILEDKNLSAPKELLAKLWMVPYEDYAKINQDMLVLVKGLSVSNYIVGVISNTQESHNIYNKNRGLFEYFEPLILSNRVGLRKPGKEIFALYLEKTGCKPEEAVFIDDEEQNLVNAKEMGIHTIHFQNQEQLESELIALGIKL